jgi:hypothetical protein
LKKNIPENEHSVMSNGFEDVQSEVPSVPSNKEEEEDEKTETPEGVTEAAEGTADPEEDDGEEVVPVGSVDAEGNVVDRQGHVVGRVEGEIPEGSLVDTEGDILDAEGNVIGKAEVDISQTDEGVEDAVGQTAESASSALSAPEVEKPELAGPFGVQDNGEVTNATGVAIGQLARRSCRSCRSIN